MPASMERSKVHVEGKDDRHSLVHLLIRHGIGYDTEPWPSELPKFKEIGGIDKLLTGIETAVMSSSGRVIAFVLDADSPLADRWQAVRDRLRMAEVESPTDTPPEGFIGRSEKYKSKVGVWLMPDNQREGKLEHFLQTLIDEHDPLIQYAAYATKQALKKGAAFSEPDQDKAVVRTWLAWQKVPGLPFGSAMKAQFFQHNSPAADAFVDWFRRLFEIT